MTGINTRKNRYTLEMYVLYVLFNLKFNSLARKIVYNIVFVITYLIMILKTRSFIQILAG